MPGSLSISETSCSSPKNDTVSSALKNDRVRYQRKGYGLIFAIIITTSFFFALPKFELWIWHSYMTFANEKIMIYLGVTVLPFTLFYIGQLMMYIIYVIKIPFFERYRIQEKPWPWEKDSAKWRDKLKKTLKVVLTNQVIINPLMASVSIFLRPITFRYDLESFPSLSEILFQIIIFMVIEDTLFYWAHRALHHPRIYPYVHKKHHEYYTAVSISALYSHPIEYIFSNAMPTGLAFILLRKRAHFATILIWLTIRVFETIDGHCGYEFSWSPYRLLPMSGSAEYHNFHHSHNSGGFASFFTYWDTICGTNKDYFIHKSKKEKEKALDLLRKQYE